MSCEPSTYQFHVASIASDILCRGITPSVELPLNLEWSRGQNVTVLKCGGGESILRFTEFGRSRLNLPRLH